MAGFPDFASFYREVNGRDPFPWQKRLANLVEQSGWPSLIGVPTGLGKTACLDIAVWALASQARIAPVDRSVPTRIWYVVNRRLLIDEAFSHGAELARMLADQRSLGAESQAVGFVGTALRSLTPLGPAKSPLQVVRMRGGGELGARPIDPSQPAIIFATVAMFASRWLFRGYGTSRSMRPVDAALAGIDSLVLLDEAHLSRPLLDLARKLAQCDVGDPSRVICPGRSRPVMVAITATGQRAQDRFELDVTDLEHPVVDRRLNAAKSIRLSETAERSIARDLATSATELLDAPPQPGSCVVFVNTPKLARQVVRELESVVSDRDRGCELLMATGRLREREAAAVRRRLLDPECGAPAARDRSAPREHDLIVVATQTLEVGADLDFDALVTEACGTRALVQRLGRLNRLGEAARAAGVVAYPADRTDWPVYGDEPIKVWTALRAAAENGSVDLSPSRSARILGPPEDEPPRVGELLQAHLWEWAKTSFPPMGEAPVALFFDGFDEAAARVSICWRAHMPADGVRLFPGVKEDESVELPIWELRAALGEREITEIRRLADDRASLETIAPDALRAGDEIVLPTNAGLYDEQGWNPKSLEDVLDASLLVSGVLPLSRSALNRLAPGIDVEAPLSRLSDPGEDNLAPDEERELANEMLGRLRDGSHHPWLTDQEWIRFLDGITHEIHRSVDDVPFMQHPRAERERVDVRAEAFEEMSFDVNSLALDDHHGVVDETASKIAAALGIPPSLAESLSAAARLHDIGKADPRFQRWLDPGPEGVTLKAKSRSPRHLIEAQRAAAGWPRGGRHKLLSLWILSELVAAREVDSPWDADLVLHLVAAHHGHGRPLVPPTHDPGTPSFMVEVEGSTIEVTCGLGWVDWTQPTRFRKLCERYGYWGLALMEAIVRQSDGEHGCRVMQDQLAPGLSADWLNGWLAAVGVTVLASEVRLSWTSDPLPAALFQHPGDLPLAERIARVLPDQITLEGLVLASFPRKVTLEAFRAGAERARDRADTSPAWSVSDLATGRSFDPSDLPHGAFDRPAPRGITLLARAASCCKLLEPDPASRIADTLAGAATRQQGNGLGFDVRRIPSGIQPGAAKMVDPVVECLCFAALRLFPVRGNGSQVAQRGWSRPPSHRAAFTWPVWSQPLDAAGIDALLDRFYGDSSKTTLTTLGVIGTFASVPFQPTGVSDPTRGYGSERSR